MAWQTKMERKTVQSALCPECTTTCMMGIFTATSADRRYCDIPSFSEHRGSHSLFCFRVCSTQLKLNLVRKKTAQQ